MANRDIPNGLRPVGYLNGATWNGKVNKYYVPATDGTAIFIGDAVKSAGSASADGKYPDVAQAAAGDAIRGVVVGFEVDPDNINYKYRPASTAMTLLVCDDPDAIFEIQEDSVGGALAVTEVGENADLVVGSGSTTTGLSGMELDSSDHKSATAQLRILRLVDRPDNELGTNARWQVLINEHELKSTTGV